MQKILKVRGWYDAKPGAEHTITTHKNLQRFACKTERSYYIIVSFFFFFYLTLNWTLDTAGAEARETIYSKLETKDSKTLIVWNLT